MNPRVRDRLDALGIDYRIRRHDELGVKIGNPADFAAAIRYDIRRVTKTLLVSALDRPAFGLVVLSCNRRVRMQTVARLMSTKRIRLASKEELDHVLGFSPTGVAPVGAAGLPVFIDLGLMSFSSVLIGSGTVAVEIEIGPSDLVRASDGIVEVLVEE